MPNPDGLASALQHGTKVAGCGFMTPDNGIGGVGTGYNCKFVPIKVTDSFGSIVSGYQSIDYAVLKKMKVLNLSWGSQGAYSQIEQDIINNAANNDVLIVAAGGNAIADAIYYPAGYDNVLAVAATSVNDTLCTTRSNIIDICFPGNDVVATTRSDAYVFTSGSSFASPGAAGAAALVRSHFPNYNCLQVAEQLRVTADIIDTIPTNQKFKGKIGLGRMNMYRALTETNVISVRSTQNTAVGSTGNIIVVNDQATLVSRFVNFLAPSSGVIVKLTSKSPYVKIIDSVFTISSLGTLDSVKNTNSPFTFKLNNGAPFNLTLDFTFRFDYGKGFIDYQNFTLNGLNPDFLDLDSNAITASITNNGRIGFVTPGFEGGNGFTYRGYNLQYQMGIMMNTHKNKLSNCLIGADGQNCDNDFSPLLNAQYVDVPFADQYITNTLVENNANKLGIQITQRSYEVKTSPLNKTVFLEYRIKNSNSTTLDSLNFSLYTDWDIPTIGTTDPNYYTYNRCVWDESRKMSYNYNLFVNTVLAGTVLLTDDKPIFYALDNAYSPTNLYNGFSDTEKYLISSNGTAKNKSGYFLATGGDVSENVGYTLFNIAPGETRIVAFAVMAGDNLLELQTAALAAQTTFRQMKTSPAPILALNNNICKNTSIVINPTNVDSIAVSKQIGGTLLYKGLNFASGFIKKRYNFLCSRIGFAFCKR